MEEPGSAMVVLVQFRGQEVGACWLCCSLAMAARRWRHRKPWGRLATEETWALGVRVLSSEAEVAAPGPQEAPRLEAFQRARLLPRARRQTRSPRKPAQEPQEVSVEVALYIVSIHQSRIVRLVRTISWHWWRGRPSTRNWRSSRGGARHYEDVSLKFAL